VPDLGVELHLGRLVGVFWREHDVDLVRAPLVRRIVGTLDVSFPVAEVAAKERNLDGGLFGLSNGRVTVLAKSSYSFLILSSFFCIDDTFKIYDWRLRGSSKEVVEDLQKFPSPKRLWGPEDGISQRINCGS
jgi:hypothetical protein